MQSHPIMSGKSILVLAGSNPQHLAESATIPLATHPYKCANRVPGPLL